MTRARLSGRRRATTTRWCTSSTTDSFGCVTDRHHRAVRLRGGRSGAVWGSAAVRLAGVPRSGAVDPHAASSTRAEIVPRCLGGPIAVASPVAVFGQAWGEQRRCRLSLSERGCCSAMGSFPLPGGLPRHRRSTTDPPTTASPSPVRSAPSSSMCPSGGSARRWPPESKLRPPTSSASVTPTPVLTRSSSQTLRARCWASPTWCWGQGAGLAPRVACARADRQSDPGPKDEPRDRSRERRLTDLGPMRAPVATRCSLEAHRPPLRLSVGDGLGAAAAGGVSARCRWTICRGREVESHRNRSRDAAGHPGHASRFGALRYELDPS